ncbi:MAG TPA: methylated-DNA--[protein]-cysteine S-methyltransferase [Methylocystis sp.]|jgi:methylated-DNA-[protein]-cysteine S-methyltransferase
MIRYDYQSPIGVLALVADDAALHGLSFENGKHGGPLADAQPGTNAIIDATRKQLDAYFAGRGKTFDLPLAPDGADFQKRVWRALATIPFGETRSYGEIAAMIGAPQAARALGAANGRNAIPVIVPCHRVIGADGSLTGFGGGMERKRFLLALEGGEPAALLWT